MKKCSYRNRYKYYKIKNTPPIKKKVKRINQYKQENRIGDNAHTDLEPGEK